MKLNLYIENGNRRVSIASIDSDTGSAKSVGVNSETRAAFLLMYDFLGMRLGLPAREGAVIPNAVKPNDE